MSARKLAFCESALGCKDHVWKPDADEEWETKHCASKYTDYR